jgi:4Fe-4S ferredoxin
MRDGADACKQPPGVFVPVVNRARCEGKEDCVRACPYEVFAVRELNQRERQALPFFARLKALAHGNRQAFTLHGESCHACALCVAVCPQSALDLTRIGAAAPT